MELNSWISILLKYFLISCICTSSTPCVQHRSCGIPRSNNNILVTLQPNKPPTTSTHNQASAQSSNHNPKYRTPPSPAPDHANTTSSSYYEDHGQDEMALEGDVFEVPTEYGKETEDLDGE